jgi:hypothetical protein
MSTLTLEERLALLEQEVLQLKRQLHTPAAIPWGENITGVFTDTPAFDEAVTFGRQYRKKRRDRRIRLVTNHPTWALGKASEV